jgi:hypothetical protein
MHAESSSIFVRSCCSLAFNGLAAAFLNTVGGLDNFAAGWRRAGTSCRSVTTSSGSSGSSGITEKDKLNLVVINSFSS